MSTDDRDLMDAFLDILAASELVDILLKIVQLVGALGIVVGLLFLVMSTPHHHQKGHRR
jgi:hypothetical protein